MNWLFVVSVSTQQYDESVFVGILPSKCLKKRATESTTQFTELRDPTKRSMGLLSLPSPKGPN